MSVESADQQDQFKLLADESIDGVVISDTAGLIWYANPAFRGMSGFGDGAIGSLISDYHSPANLPNVLANILPRLMAEGRWQGELEHTRLDGTSWLAQLSAVVLSDPNGEPIAIGTLFRDVTEQRRRDREVRGLYQRMEQSFATSPLATVEVDRTGVIVRWNPAAERIFGWSNADALGKDALGLLVPNLAPDEVRAFLNHILSASATNIRIANTTRAGRVITCQWHVAVIRDSAGEIDSWLVQTEDVTEQLRAENERNELQEQIIAAQQATLREIGTPIIPISEGVVAMPLVGAIDRMRAQQVIETLLEGVAASQAELAILDITGVKVVDTEVANALLQAAQAVRMLGAQLILTGIKPEVAQIFVSLGIDLSGITTLATLESGITYALSRK